MVRSAQAMVKISERKLEALLRKVVRQVIHDELEKTLRRKPELIEPWMSDPESPLFQDMMEIREDIQAGRMKLLSDKEVWGSQSRKSSIGKF